MSRKIQITPLMELQAEVTVMNDRNASVALVHLWDTDAGEDIAHATGASKREQGDQYNEDVAVKLAVGRALQKMSRGMISQANREVKAAMAEAEARAADKLASARAEFDANFYGQADADAADEEFISDLMALLGLTPDGQEAPLPFLQDDGSLADVLTHALDGEKLNADGVPTTADGTPVDQLPVSLRTTLASLGFKPSQVQIINLDKLEAEGAI